jgi:hypothetical protein
MTGSIATLVGDGRRNLHRCEASVLIVLPFIRLASLFNNTQATSGTHPDLTHVG